MVDKEPKESFEAAATKVYDFLNVNDKPEKANVIFILGNSTLTPVEKAAELYHAGYAPKIAFISTGGNFGGQVAFGMPKNQKYKEVLLEKGIPEKAIISDGLTTNTLVEAQTAIPFLRQHGIDP